MRGERQPSKRQSAFEPGNALNGHPRIALDVTDEFVEAVARRAAEIVVAAQDAPSPWLSTEQAAEHLAAKPDRVHDLVALGKLTPRRDGRRLLFHRADLDAYIEGSG